MYILGKKSTELPVEGPSTALASMLWLSAELSGDNATGREIHSNGPDVMQYAKRGQNNFPTVIKIHNPIPPFYFGMRQLTK